LPFDYVTVQTSRDPGFLAHVNVAGGKVAAPNVLLAEEKRPIRFLTKEQIEVCHKTLTNSTHQLMFELMVRTGLRQMECRTFPDAYVFDPTRRKDLKPGQKIRLHIDPKDMEIKNKKPRDIDVPYDLMEKLWAYSVRRRQGRANNHPEGKTFPTLFLSEAGIPYRKDAVTAIFRALAGRVGFPVKAHMLRHSYATYLLWSLRKSKTFEGEPLLYVRDRMGHSDVSTTTIYLHLINSLEGNLVLAHEDEIDQLLATTLEAESA
jgi:site-specific recombinase XerD